MTQVTTKEDRLREDRTTLVEIDYTNYRGERGPHTIQPLGLHFTATDFHPDRQWLMFALKRDETGVMVIRAYALRDIHSWKPL